MGEIKKEKEISWINAVKLISCILVFVSHYFSSFYFLDAAQTMSPGIYAVLGKCTGIINGTLWVMVFCFISGVFAANKNIESLKGLAGESLYRYIRLAIPIFITGLLIFAMSQFGLLINQSASEIFHCSSYLDAYYQSKIKFFDYLWEALTFGSVLNPPLWMMGMLLDGNIIIYVCNYISNKAKRNGVGIALYVSMTLFCCLTNKLYQAVCLTGAIASGFFPQNRQKSIKESIAALSISAVLFVLAYVDAFSKVICGLSGSLSVSFNEIKCFIAACAIMIFINECAPIQRLLSADFINKISKYNYTIYLVHFPIICSLSIYLYKLLLPSTSYDFTFIIVFIITAIVVGIVTALYSMIFDKKTNEVMHCLRNKIEGIEKKLPDF